jgi:hypothetical protein
MILFCRGNDGMEIYEADWYRNHAKKEEYLRGLHIAEDALSGKTASLYCFRRCMLGTRTGGPLTVVSEVNEREIQREHLDRLVALRLHFSCTLMDNWYFCTTRTRHIEQLGKDWVTESKTNRLVTFQKRWFALKCLAQTLIQDTKFRVVQLRDNTSMRKVMMIRMNGMGIVRLLVSLNIHGNCDVYVSNRLDRDEIAMIA